MEGTALARICAATWPFVGAARDVRTNIHITQRGHGEMSEGCAVGKGCGVATLKWQQWPKRCQLKNGEKRN